MKWTSLSLLQSRQEKYYQHNPKTCDSSKSLLHFSGITTRIIMIWQVLHGACTNNIHIIYFNLSHFSCLDYKERGLLVSLFAHYPFQKYEVQFGPFSHVQFVDADGTFQGNMTVSYF